MTRRSIRCPHGCDRTLVPCEPCGDKPKRLGDARVYRPKKRESKSPWLPPHRREYQPPDR